MNFTKKLSIDLGPVHLFRTHCVRGSQPEAGVTEFSEGVLAFFTELLKEVGDGDLSIKKRGNAVEAILTLIEVGEVDAEEDAPSAPRSPGPWASPDDIVRSDAGFTSGPIWVGGLGEYTGPGVYWSEADRGITHEMLMDACKGMSASLRQAAHYRAGVVARKRGGQPTVRDLIESLNKVREMDQALDIEDFLRDSAPDLRELANAVGAGELEEAPEPPEVLRYIPSDLAEDLSEADEPGYSVVDIVERLERPPVTRDAALIELERLGQEADLAIAAKVMERDHEALKMLADGAEPGCTHAPLRTEPVGWTIGWQDSFGREVPSATPGAAPFAKPLPPQEPQEAPNSAPLPQPVAASETGSPASPAAPELTPDGIEIHHPVKCTGPMRIQADLSRDVWDMSASASAPAAPALDLETAYGADLDVIAAEQFDVRRTPGETDSSLRAFLRAKQRADDDLSGCRWVNPTETATDLVADREALARVAPALHRSGDLSGAWRGSQAVEAGGRFHLNDISDAVND